MQKFRVAQELSADPAAYWALHFDDDFNRAFYGSVDIDYEVLRDERDERRIVREVRYTSRRPVPAYVRALLPEGLGYVERAVFDRDAQVEHQTIHPNAVEGRSDIRATLEVKALGQGRCLRSYAGTVSIQVPLIGPRLERNTVKNIHESQDRAGAVTRAWLARASRSARGPSVNS